MPLNYCQWHETSPGKWKYQLEIKITSATQYKGFSYNDQKGKRKRKYPSGLVKRKQCREISEAT